MKKVTIIPHGEIPGNPIDAPAEPQAHGSVPADDPGKKQDQVNHIGEHLLGRDLGNGIPDRMLSSRETAFILNMSPSWLNKQRVSGGEDIIPFHKLGRRVQYHPRDVRIALVKARRLSTSQSEHRLLKPKEPR
jgi:hypothetical protein